MKLLNTLVVLLLTVGVGVERSLLLLVDAESIIIADVVAERGIDDAIGEPSSSTTSRIAEEEKDGDESREGGDTAVEPCLHQVDRLRARTHRAPGDVQPQVERAQRAL